MAGALYGGLFAVMLWWTPRNRAANRMLAMLLLVIALQLLPYIIGYAGFYDAFPWLSYLPYEASLAFGPLLYFYVRGLAAPSLPPGWRRHFVPVALQLAYYCVIFPFPLAFKNHWNETVHVPYLVPLEQLATFASIAVYWWLSFRSYRRYQAWLADNVSDREDHHVEWLRNFLIALGVTLVFWIGLAAFERLVAALNYFEQFPFYVWLTVLSYYLGTEGYRNSGHRYPQWTLDSASTTIAETMPEVAARDAPDWQARGAKWRAQLVEAGWWRDPDLTLASLARKLGTNTSDLSRAINEGLGLNFNELINRLRVEDVKTALQSAPSEKTLLEIAVSSGFSSKASFNRSFKLYAFQTPSEYRQSISRLSERPTPEPNP